MTRVDGPGPEHVPNYHEWMKDPALLEATGSEPLSFAEEVAMQKEWRDDEKKCTFIVHAREECRFEKSAEIETNPNSSFQVEDNLHAMIGDVNLFLSEIDDEEDETDAKENSDVVDLNCEGNEASGPPMQAEIDIMIARKDYRGKGLGRESTCGVLLYGSKKLGIERFFCKINEDNIDSIRLFKSIGFVQCDYSACFKQVELELRKPLVEMEKIFNQNGGSYSILHCEEGK